MESASSAAWLGQRASPPWLGTSQRWSCSYYISTRRKTQPPLTRDHLWWDTAYCAIFWLARISCHVTAANQKGLLYDRCLRFDSSDGLFYGRKKNTSLYILRFTPTRQFTDEFLYNFTTCYCIFLRSKYTVYNACGVLVRLCSRYLSNTPLMYILKQPLL